MAKNPSTKGTEEVKPSTGIDPDMEGLNEWNPEEGEKINFKRLFFKPKEAGKGAVLRGYLVGLQPMVSVHDGESHEGHGLIIATTRPALLTDSNGVTSPHPKGTEALIYATTELLDLMPYAEQKKVVEIGILVGERKRTGSGNTLQTMEFQLFNQGKGFERGEVARLSINPALRKIGLAVGMDSAGNLPAATNGTQANPVLPQ